MTKRTFSTLAILLALLIGLHSQAKGATLVINPTVDQAAEDTNADNVVDTLLNASDIQLWAWGAFYDFTPYRRSALEFDISGIPAGSTVNSATFRFTWFGYRLSTVVEVHGYTGDGTITLSDMSDSTGLGDMLPSSFSLSVTSFVESLMANGDSFAGFMTKGKDAVSQITYASSEHFNPPTLTVDYDPPITVTPTSGLTTTEAGGTDTFEVVLNTQPTASVTVALSSSDITEGTVSPATLTFTTATWSTPQTVTVTGVDDAVADGSQAYTIQTGAAVSDDPTYKDLDPADVSVTNLDDEIVHNLTVNKTGTGAGTATSTPAGIDCGATCSAGFLEGTRVTVTATPDANSALDGWSGGGCLGNGECTLLMDQDSTITATFNPDGDSDGISDVMEAAGPYGGDGNRDGLPDSVQATVATFRTINGDYVTLVSETGSELKDVVATVNPSSNDAPGWESFPQGFFGFKVTGLTPGQKTTVSLILHQMQVITTYYKYGPTPDNVTDHWYQFFSDGTIGARIVQKSYSTTIYLDFIDGLRGDDDLLANGEITDLGAPTIPASTGDSGCFVSQAASRPPVTK